MPHFTSDLSECVLLELAKEKRQSECIAIYLYGAATSVGNR